MLKAAMQKKKGDKDTFTMTGQYASPVMYDEETSREFVMYESPNGEEVQVFGNWNEYAVAQDEAGKDMIADEDYPIRKNENGEFVFDEAKFEEMMQGVEPEKEMAPQMTPESPAEKVRRMMMGGKIDMMPGGGPMDKKKPMSYEDGGKMKYPGGGRMDYRKGGKFPDLTGDGKVTMADILKGRGVNEKREGGKIDEYAGGGYMTYENGGSNDPEKQKMMRKTVRPNLRMKKTMRPMPMSEEQKAAMEKLSREDLMRILKTAARR